MGHHSSCWVERTYRYTYVSEVRLGLFSFFKPKFPQYHVSHETSFFFCRFDFLPTISIDVFLCLCFSLVCVFLFPGERPTGLRYIRNKRLNWVKWFFFSGSFSSSQTISNFFTAY